MLAAQALLWPEFGSQHLWNKQGVWHGALSKTETERIMGLLVSSLTKEKKRKKASSGSKERPPKA